MFFETSGDILNLVLALAIVWVVLLVSILLFHAIAVVRSARHIVDEVKSRLFSIDMLLQVVRGAVDRGLDHLGLLASVAKQGISFVGGKVSGVKKKKAKAKK